MLKVVVEISDAQIRNCAYDVVERLIIDECDYDSDAVELSGIEIKELVRDLAAYPVFHQALIKMVRECGIESLDYDEKTMFANYDSEGYDSYGYSAFDDGGNYCGVGGGVDRNGYTEMDYLCMNLEEFLSHS